MRDNSDSIAYLLMVFMAKNHQFFHHLALFLQNSINTNKIEMGDNKFDIITSPLRLGPRPSSSIKCKNRLTITLFPRMSQPLLRVFLPIQWGEGLFLHQQVTKQKKRPPFNKLMVTVGESVSQTAKSSKGRIAQKRVF